MADGSSTNVLFDSVRFVLSNWAVLQLAVEHSFGGIDSREKAEWMVDVVDQVLRENETIENDELESYIEEILFNEFHTMAEDGSLPKIVQKLCGFHKMWKQGNTAQIQQEISLAPITKPPQCVKKRSAATQIDSDDDDDDDDDEDNMGTREAQAVVNGHDDSSTVSQQLDRLHISQNSKQSPSSLVEPGQSQSPNDNSLRQSPSQPDQDEEGWEIVRRSKKR